MANVDAAFGFRPTRSLVGGQIRTEEYKIAANYDTRCHKHFPDRKSVV